MIPDKNRVYDGFLSLEAGVDAGRAPENLDANQCEQAENVTFRGGHPMPRPGWRKMAEGFRGADPLGNYHCYYVGGLDAGMDGNGNWRQVAGHDAPTIYKNGYFQGACTFSPHSPNGDCIMAMIGGRLYKIVPQKNTAEVTEITPIVDNFSPYPGKAAYRNRWNNSIAYMIQADKFLIVQDGQAKPIIYDAQTARRSRSDSTDAALKEVPVGTIMAYGMGRICVVVNDRDIAFGDLYGSHLDTQTDPADSLPLFTERNFLAGGFDAAIPFQQGVATGMAFFPQLDTSTGTGPLLVFAERGAASFALDLDRSVWQTSAFQTIALLTTGLRGSRSVSVVNEDLWFRSDDGVRGFRQARSEQYGWAHIPLSTNVRQYLENDSQELLKYASGIYFDNRVLTTTSPVWNNGRVYHEGVVVADFDILSSFGSKSKEAWDGHWLVGTRENQPINLPTQKICQLVSGTINGVARAFAFCLDTTQSPPVNQLYELTSTERSDWDGVPVDWEFDSRSFNFVQGQQSTPYTEVELYDGDIWLREIADSQSGVVPITPFTPFPDQGQ